MKNLLEIKKNKAAQLSKELETVKTLLDIAPADRQQQHYERAEALLKELEEVNADIRLLQQGQAERTLAVNGQIPGIVVSNTKSQQRAAMDTQQAEYRTAFFSYLQGKATAHQRELVTAATGAAVIPVTTFEQIIENVQKQQGLLSRVRVLNIPGNLSIPRSDINTPAAWHVEGAPIDDSNLPPDNVTLGGFELAKLFSMSAATQSMSIDAFEQYLVTELGRCTRDALNAVIYDGLGATQPLGLLNGIVWDETNSTTANDWTSLLQAMSLMPSNFRQNAVFVMNSLTFYGFVAAQSDANGQPLLTREVASGAPLRLLGKEIIIDDFCPDDTIFFCDPSFYFFNFSKPIAIERSSEAGFTTGTILYRSMAVVDGKPVTPLAFVNITVASGS